ncbi:hypothetical protein MNBD_GAMMA24-2762, partial [hydrothermal vent metagenome]
MNYSFILMLFFSVFSTSSFALNTTVEQLLKNYR